jgi:four helix bundle protein
MAFAERFEDLEIWQVARRLNREVYLAFKPCRSFFYRDQAGRAALSVMNNIAEGFERRTPKDFAHFLDTAKSSSGEVRSITYAAEDVGILDTTVAVHLRANYALLSKRIAAFQRHLRREN